MPKFPEDPKQWLPVNNDIPVEKMDLLQAWSKYHKEIARYRNFRNKDETIANYTGTLKIIEDALKEKYIYQLDPFVVMDMVMSVPGRMNSRGEYIEYSANTLTKRLTIIRDILLYIESAYNCVNPLSYKMYTFVKDGLTLQQTSDEVKEYLKNKYKNKILPRYLSKKQEQRLMREILAHIEEDGRWLALAILLWCGARASEVRGLRFDDIKTFTDYIQRQYICFCRAAQNDGSEKPDMKNKYGPRSLPAHVELQCVLAKRMEFVEKNCGRADISSLPAITNANNFEQACTASDLLSFVQTQLRKVCGKEFVEENMVLFYLTDPEKIKGIDGDAPEDPLDQMVDMQLGTRLFRRNFSTKNYAETLLLDWQSRLEMGHKTDSKVTAPYGEAHLLEMLYKMDHRMILPEIRDDWHTIFAPGTNTIYKDDVGVHYISVAKEDISKLEKIVIDVDLDTIGDDFSLEFFRKFPADALKISAEYVPKKVVPPFDSRTNTDAAHWPLSFEVAKKSLENRKKRNE